MTKTKAIEYFDPHFNGTEQYHAYNFFGRRIFLYTDSVLTWAEKYGAFWTLDVIASYMPQIGRYNREHNDNSFMIFTFDVTPRRIRKDGKLETIGAKCRFEAKEDTDAELVAKQNIEYTDLPQSVRLYMMDNVLMFPSDN